MNLRGSILGLFLLLASGTAAAHDFHVTLAEADLNPETAALEVALQIPNLDLEDELARLYNEPPVLEAEAADSLMAALVAEHFVFTRADSTPAPLRWVGKEIGVRDSWLYFELLDVRPLAGASLRNTLGMAAHAQQVNTVNLRVDGRLRTLAFTRAERRFLLASAGSAKPDRSEGPASATDDSPTATAGRRRH